MAGDSSVFPLPDHHQLVAARGEEDPFFSFLSLSPHATAARVGGGVEEGGKETPVAFVRFLEEEQGG